ncbi:MAG: hypothetical protein D6743_04740 [Calditrichaeota bacterium]|nr:MAG: hypothetical protein D6743_04740 [Calditrichota bacterium]
MFFIEKARVELDRDLGDQRFEVEGRFVLDGASDGVNVLNEEVTIVFDGFTAVLPPGSFQRDDEEFEFEEDRNGLKEVKIRLDGRFEVEGRDLTLSGITLPQSVFFSLRIGNDVGETEIPFDNDGRFENPNPFPSPSPSPTPEETPTPEPTPSVSPSPSPSPSGSPSPSPSPTPTESPTPEPSPSVSPSPSPSPTGTPSPSPSATPELHVRGPIQQLVVRGAKDGDVTVQNIVFQVSSNTELEDDDGRNVTLDHFKLGEEVDAWGPPAVDGKTPAKRIRAR